MNVLKKGESEECKDIMFSKEICGLPKKRLTTDVLRGLSSFFLCFFFSYGCSNVSSASSSTEVCAIKID